MGRLIVWLQATASIQATADEGGVLSGIGGPRGVLVRNRAPTGGRELDDVRTVTRVSFWGCPGGSGPRLANAGAELLDCATAWRAHSSGRHRSRSPESSHQVGLLDHLRYPATRSSRSPEDGGPRDVSRETGARVWTHRRSSRTKSNGPVDPACRGTGVGRVRLLTAATGRGRRGRSTTRTRATRVPGADQGSCGGSHDDGMVQVSWTGAGGRSDTDKEAVRGGAPVWRRGARGACPVLGERRANVDPARAGAPIAGPEAGALTDPGLHDGVE